MDGNGFVELQKEGDTCMPCHISSKLLQVTKDHMKYVFSARVDYIPAYLTQFTILFAHCHCHCHCLWISDRVDILNIQ